MAGRIIFTPEVEPVHLCTIDADPKKLERGTIWQCDDCFRTWVLVLSGSAPNAEPTIKVWRRLTDSNSDGLDL